MNENFSSRSLPSLKEELYRAETARKYKGVTQVGEFLDLSEVPLSLLESQVFFMWVSPASCLLPPAPMLYKHLS